MIISSSLLLALCLGAAPEAAPAPAPERPRLVILPVNADARAKGGDTNQFPGMLHSELSSAARGADVIMLEDAAAMAAVMDPVVLRCQDLSCASAVGAAVKARYVVATQVASVGKDRQITVRLQDVEQDRLVAMITEKVGRSDEALPPVAARAALRLSAAAKIRELPEAPKPAPAPAPEPAPVAAAPAPTPTPAPVQDNPKTIIIVQQPAQVAPVAPPPVVEGPPPAPATAMGDPLYAPAPVQPVAAPVEEPGRKVPWSTRTAIMVVGLLLAGWMPLVAPVLGAISAWMFVRAFDVKTELESRPHARAEIATKLASGQQSAMIGYALIAGAVALLVVGVAVPVTCVVVALVLP